jgi:hypothetical protein
LETLLQLGQQAAEPIPAFLLDMVEAGGLLAQLQQRFQPRTQT